MTGMTVAHSQKKKTLTLLFHPMSYSQSMSSKTVKRLGVENLFLFTFCSCALSGAVAYLLPHVFGCFLVPHGEKLSLRDNSVRSDMEPHLILRLYGTAQLAFAYVSWSARALKDPEARRSLIRAFFLMYALCALAMLRAQLAHDSILSAWNWNVGSVLQCQ